jgi:hypothetical protein
MDLYLPVICDACGVYIDNKTYFATDIGQAVVYGVGFCSVACWLARQEQYRRYLSRKSF